MKLTLEFADNGGRDGRRVALWKQEKIVCDFNSRAQRKKSLWKM